MSASKQKCPLLSGAGCLLPLGPVFGQALLLAGFALLSSQAGLVGLAREGDSLCLPSPWQRVCCCLNGEQLATAFWLCAIPTCGPFMVCLLQRIAFIMKR